MYMSLVLLLQQSSEIMTAIILNLCSTKLSQRVIRKSLRGRYELKQNTNISENISSDLFLLLCEINQCVLPLCL